MTESDIIRLVTNNDDDSGDGSTVGNIMQILMGLAKSYFNIKGKSNASIQVGNILTNK